MSTPRLFGGSKSSARGNGPDLFFERDEARRRFLQSNLYPGFAARVAARIGRTAGWVYRRLEGHAQMSPALELELLCEIPPEAAVRRIREDAARFGLAVAEIPGATGLQETPPTRLAAAIPALARAAEGALDALLDGIVTPDEAEAVRKDTDAATVLAVNAAATLEAAAGRRLV